jgi:PPOX class probable F420-dependent enzyme
MTNLIPESHEDLLSDDRPVVAALATIMPDGSPQVTPVWCDREGEFIRINTTRGRVKERNMSVRPRVALTVVDPDDMFRHVQIRGEVAGSTEEGAHAHIRALSQKYTGHDFRPLNPGEVRVIFRIRPTSITAE